MLSDKTTYTSTCTEDEEGNVILDIPEELLEALNWGEGTLLDIETLPNTIVLREVKSADAPENGRSIEGECSVD